MKTSWKKRFVRTLPLLVLVVIIAASAVANASEQEANSNCSASLSFSQHASGGPSEVHLGKLTLPEGCVGPITMTATVTNNIPQVGEPLAFHDNTLRVGEHAYPIERPGQANEHKISDSLEGTSFNVVVLKGDGDLGLGIKRGLSARIEVTITGQLAPEEPPVTTEPPETTQPPETTTPPAPRPEPPMPQPEVAPPPVEIAPPAKPVAQQPQFTG